MFDVDQLTKYLKIRFDSLGFTLIISILFWFVFVHQGIINYKIDDWLSPSLSLSLFILILVIILWCLFRYFRFFYISKPNNKKIRILIWIHSENDKQKLRLKEDFIDKIQESSEAQDNAFEILELKESYIKNIYKAKNKSKYIKKINKKIRWHLYIYWKIRERWDKWVKTYILTPRYMLFHRKVDKWRKKRLQLNMNSVWTKSQFAVDNEVEGFEITSNTVFFIIRYFIWISAVFSDLILIGYKMHKPLLTDLNKAKDLPHKWFIRNELYSVLEEEVSVLSSYYLSKQKYKKFFNINKVLPSIWQQGLFFLRQWIYHYKNWSIDKAFESIKKSMKKDDKKWINAWKYSRAYLYLISKNYKEFLKDINSSKEIYTKLKAESLLKEDFILHFYSEMTKFALIDYEDTKNPDLLFWIWYLNLYFLENTPEAFSYFERIENEFSDYFNPEHYLYKEYTNCYNHCKKTILWKQ